MGWTIMAMKNSGDTGEAGQMAQRAWGGAELCHDIQIADPWTPLSQPAVSAPFDLCLSHTLTSEVAHARFGVNCAFM